MNNLFCCYMLVITSGTRRISLQVTGTHDIATFKCILLGGGM